MLVSSFHRTRMPRLLLALLLAWAGARSGECFGWSTGSMQVGLAAGRGGAPALARRHGAGGRLAGGRLAGGRWARALVRLQVVVDAPALVDAPAHSSQERAGQCFESAVQAYQDAARLPEAAAAKRDERLVHGMRLLREVFELDFQVVEASHYVASGTRTLTNVTCMRPRGGQHDDSGFIMNEELLAMDLEPGRLCEGGACCDACSRVQLRALATDAECAELLCRADALMPPSPPRELSQQREQVNLQFQFTAAAGDIRLHLMYIRMLERMRRAVAREYGLPLSTISLTQSFVSRLRCYDLPGQPHPAGPVHVDECSTVDARTNVPRVSGLPGKTITRCRVSPLLRCAPSPKPKTQNPKP